MHSRFEGLDEFIRKPWLIFLAALEYYTVILKFYLERDFNCSLSKESQYFSRMREDISAQFFPIFFCSLMNEGQDES